MGIEQAAKEGDYYFDTVNIAAYLSKIAKYPLLTRDKEVALAKRIKKGDEKARELMINSNLRLVVSIAKEERYYTTHMNLFDKIQAGNIGLIEAVNRFDNKHKVRFSTYATYWIIQNIGTSIKKEERTIRIPIGAYVEQSAVYKAIDKNNGGLSIEELHKKTGVSIKSIKSFTEYNIKNISSLDCNIKDYDITLGELIEDKNSADPVEFAYNRSLRENLENILKKLTPKEEKVIRMRFGLFREDDGDGIPNTLDGIGKKMGLTRERVRQIEYNALLRLRKPAEKLNLM